MDSAPLPLPGRPVRGSDTGRPLMAALDLFGRRWALRLVWELRDGPLGPRELLRRCEGLSSSVLYQRLADLSEAAVVEVADGVYGLTPLGSRLGAALGPLQDWSEDWAGALRER